MADGFNLESHFIDSAGLLSWRMFRDSPDFEFVDWDFPGTSAQDYDHLKQLIHSSGYQAYLAEYRFLGTYTCRVIIPGMSEVYPLDDLVWNNRTSGTALRPQLLRLKQLSCDELAAFTENLDALGLNDQQPISDLIGVVFPEGSAWESLRVGELKAMLGLATGDTDQASQWCRWCDRFGGLAAPRQQLYRLICTLLEFEAADEDPSDYASSLRLLFGDELLSTAHQITKGEITFHGLNFADSWEELSPPHEKLLALYNKLHHLKTATQ